MPAQRMVKWSGNAVATLWVSISLNPGDKPNDAQT